MTTHRATALLAVLAGCYVCPTVPPPDVLEVATEVYFDAGPGTHVWATVQGADLPNMMPTWVCSCECSEVWATVAPSELGTDTPEPVPFPIDPGKYADLIVGVTKNASGDAECTAVLSSRERLILKVTAAFGGGR